MHPRFMFAAVCLSVTFCSVAGAKEVAGAIVGSQDSPVITLVDKGEYEKARATLRKMVADRRDAPLHLAHLEALILSRNGHKKEAIELYRFILSRQPNFTPARIELSRTLGELGDYDAALHQSQLIELGSRDPEIRRQARAFGDNMRYQRPYGFGGYVSFLPSSNINKGSGHRTVMIGGLEFVIDDDSRERSGWGVGAGANAYRTLSLDEVTHLNFSGALDIKKYTGTADYDEAAVSTNVSLQRRMGALEVQVGPTMDYRLLGWEPYAFRYGLSLGGTYDLLERTRLYGGGTLLRQDFLSSTYRNGSIFLGYAGIKHAFTPALAVSATVNYTAERTQLEHLDHNDYRLVTQVDKEWQGGFITSFSAGVTYKGYLGEFPGTSVARQDHLWSAGMTLMNRNWSIRGFAPQLKYEYTRSKSNISFYDYDSHDVGLTFSKLF